MQKNNYPFYSGKFISGKGTQFVYTPLCLIHALLLASGSQQTYIVVCSSGFFYLLVVSSGGISIIIYDAPSVVVMRMRRYYALQLILRGPVVQFTSSNDTARGRQTERPAIESPHDREARPFQ